MDRITPINLLFFIMVSNLFIDNFRFVKLNASIIPYIDRIAYPFLSYFRNIKDQTRHTQWLLTNPTFYNKFHEHF